MKSTTTAPFFRARLTQRNLYSRNWDTRRATRDGRSRDEDQNAQQDHCQRETFASRFLENPLHESVDVANSEMQSMSMAAPVHRAGAV
jgi:heme-degrading monooxygenase HmoA